MSLTHKETSLYLYIAPRDAHKLQSKILDIFKGYSTTKAVPHRKNNLEFVWS